MERYSIMINFTCTKCEKELKLENRIFEKSYKGYEYCLDCRPKQGGYREGAGRPSLGETKKVSITLPADSWKVIEKKKGDLTMAAYFRNLLLNDLHGEKL